MKNQRLVLETLKIFYLAGQIGTCVCHHYQLFERFKFRIVCGVCQTFSRAETLHPFWVPAVFF